MAGPPPLVSPRVPTDFARLVHLATTESGRLQRGVELVVSLVAGCDHAGVTVLTPHFVETVAASDDVVRRGDSWQHELSEGPGLESVRRRATVVSQDLATDPRWRSWGPRAVTALGVRSMMSVLLESDGDTVGALNLYGDRPRVWDDENLALAVALAGQLTVAVADARMLDARARALLARSGMGQAQGIVMERFGLGPEEAAAYLERLAERTHLDLVHLAERIVENRDLPVLPRDGRPT